MKYYTGYFRSPIGWLEMVVSDDKLAKINFVTKNKGGQNHPYFSIIKKQLTEYFAGKRKIFSLRLNIEGTDFQKKIWQQMRKVPYGKKISYKQLAAKSGRPAAARAAGTVCRLNKIPIIIPCHRIVPAAGSVGNYAGGQYRKKYLLNMEQEH